MTRRTPRLLLNLAGSVAIVVTLVFAACGPSAGTSAALDLSDDGVSDSHVVKNTQGETLLYNFRTVERGVLYRGSDFTRTPGKDASGAPSGQPVAFQDEQTFFFLRAMNIRHVVSLVPASDFYAEEGYFRYWTERTGYAVTATSLPVAADQAYGRTDRSSLHAAGELLDIMKRHRAQDGAVLVHGEAGKDATGVVAAAYELWRSAGRADENATWLRVVQRYQASNALLSQELRSGAIAAGPAACEENGPNYVCAKSLDVLRNDLMFLAKL